MKKQLITALSVTIFLIGIGLFTFLTNTIWKSGHIRVPGPSIGEMRESIGNRTSTAASSTDSISSTEAVPSSERKEMTVSLQLSQGSKPYTTQPDTNFILYSADEARYYKEQNPLTLSGTTSKGTAKVVVTYTPITAGGNSDVYTLNKYVPGSTQWFYMFSEKLNNLKPGLNEYVARSYDKNGKLIDDITVVAYMYLSTPTTPEETTTLDVQWSEPQKVNMLDVLAKSGEVEKHIHNFGLNRLFVQSQSCTMGFNMIEEAKGPTFEASRTMLGEELVYAVGTVSAGEYTGATVYTHQESMYSCMGKIKDETLLYHFIQTKDGTLLAADKRDWDSAITEGMEWNGKSVVDAGGPNEVRIDNSGVRLVECIEGFCMTGDLFDPATTTPAAGFSYSEIPVYEGMNGCLLVKRNDGFLTDYKVDAHPEITWLDGTTSTTVYSPDPITGGCGQQPHHCHWKYEGNPADLERVGTTKQGLEVYQEIVTPAELAAMAHSSGSTTSYGMVSLHELYWSMARYDTAKIPTPKQFVAAHPAVYIKDPLARLLYFQGEQYGPSVECGKPVIYLYPEQTMNVSVYVEPTGGFTVTDPPYNDGWHVRSTPESKIYNYGNGKTYPYLFWEGHGTEYTRPTRGFMFSRTEAPTLVREKLALLGLVDNEIDDFMEFWEPRLTVKPYVFVTFVDQPTFDTIAPLTVEPAPDTVIRVFMDYEPLDAPTSVDPLPIITPVRKGFSVVEWGGALHPGDNGMCPGGILLQ